MSIADAVFLFVAGFLSGVVNAIAGGGTFLTFGAMTLTGLPPIVANATSSITQFPGYVTSALAPAGTKLFAEVRGNRVPVAVHPLPFSPHRHFKGTTA